MLRAAAQLHSIRIRRRHASRQEAACNMLRELPMPPGWTPDDWGVLTLVMRYHRGAEPIKRPRTENERTKTRSADVASRHLLTEVDHP